MGEAMLRVERAEVARLVRFGDQAWADFAKGLKGETRGSFAGWVWIVAVPLAPLGVYLALATFRVFAKPDGIHAAVYMTVGASLWLLLQGLVLAPLSAFRSKGRVAAQTGYPLLAATASGVLHVGLESLIRTVACGVIIALFMPTDIFRIALFFLALAVAWPLFLGAGLIIAIFATAVRDLERVVPLVLQYLFFLSFAIFPLPRPELFLPWNPFAVMVENLRHILLLGSLSTPWTFVGWAAVGLLILSKALRFLSRAEPHVVGRL